MPDEPVELAKINITYRRDPGASEMMTLSDGASEAVLYLSPLGGMNMLLEVIDALLQLIPYEGEHIYYWDGDQDYYRWRFQLDDEALQLQVSQLGGSYFLCYLLGVAVRREAAVVRIAAGRSGGCATPTWR